MKEFKGTKGEWSTIDKLIYRRPYSELYKYGGTLAGDKPVASVMGTGFYSEEEIQANAQLISAAPNLLEALQECILEIDVSDYVARRKIETAKQAINKALGL